MRSVQPHKSRLGTASARRPVGRQPNTRPCARPARGLPVRRLAAAGAGRPVRHRLRVPPGPRQTSPEFRPNASLVDPKAVSQACTLRAARIAPDPWNTSSRAFRRPLTACTLLWLRVPAGLFFQEFPAFPQLRIPGKHFDPIFARTPRRSPGPVRERAFSFELVWSENALGKCIIFQTNTKASPFGRRTGGRGHFAFPRPFSFPRSFIRGMTAARTTR